MHVHEVEIQMRLRREVIPDAAFLTLLTVVRADRVLYESPAAGGWEIPKPLPGDTVIITVPSGTLIVDVLSVNDDDLESWSLAGSGEWEGRYGGLLGGLSGCASWHAAVSPETLVTTSVSQYPIPWRVYEHAQNQARVLRAQVLEDNDNAAVAVLRELVEDRLPQVHWGIMRKVVEIASPEAEEISERA